MNVNLKVLNAAIALLPAPHPNKGMQYITVIDRISMSNKVYNCYVVDAKVTTETFTFILVKYCRSPGNCWYEWELDV